MKHTKSGRLVEQHCFEPKIGFRIAYSYIRNEGMLESQKYILGQTFLANITLIAGLQTRFVFIQVRVQLILTSLNSLI